MKFKGRYFLAASLTIFLMLPGRAFASLDGKIDFSHERILAFGNLNDPLAPRTAGSGYLYAPRIVLTAGHFDVIDNVGTKVAFQNNSDVTKQTRSVRIVKTFFPSSYNKKANADDFAVFVLAEPLANVPNAKLVTEEMLRKLEADHASLTITGYGVYQDMCLAQNLPTNCSADSSNFPKSTKPRSIQMDLTSYAGIVAKYGEGLVDLQTVKDHIFVISDFKNGPCSGDSGGSTTAMVNGEEYYLGTTPTGFWSGYTCGASGPSWTPYTVGYTAPVYKFLDLIKAAEDFVAAHSTSSLSPKSTAKPISITCAKGKSKIQVKGIVPVCPKGFKKQ